MKYAYKLSRGETPRYRRGIMSKGWKQYSTFSKGDLMAKLALKILHLGAKYWLSQLSHMV